MITIELSAGSTLQAALSKSGLTRFFGRACLEAGLSGEVEVLLTDDRTLRRLNKSFRGKDKPTDVLSFPSPEEISTLHAGDLAVSLETAARQASAYGHTLGDEVRILLLHGLLHLSGMDHETDQGEMAASESALRRKLSLPATLIERASRVASGAFPRTKVKKAGAREASQRALPAKAAPSSAKTPRPRVKKAATSSPERKKDEKRGTR